MSFASNENQRVTPSRMISTAAVANGRPVINRGLNKIISGVNLDERNVGTAGSPAAFMGFQSAASVRVSN